jgi:hypothetical protein
MLSLKWLIIRVLIFKLTQCTVLKINKEDRAHQVVFKRIGNYAIAYIKNVSQQSLMYGGGVAELVAHPPAEPKIEGSKYSTWHLGQHVEVCLHIALSKKAPKSILKAEPLCYQPMQCGYE